MHVNKRILQLFNGLIFITNRVFTTMALTSYKSKIIAKSKALLSASSFANVLLITEWEAWGTEISRITMDLKETSNRKK